MKYRNVLLIGLIAVVGVMLPLSSAMPAATGPPCTDRKQAVESLLTVYGEALVGSGLSNEGLLVEMYAGQSGTWTIMATAPTGRTCLIATGQAWEPARADVSGIAPLRHFTKGSP